MIRTMEQKLALLAKNPAEIFVVTHRKDDGTIEYPSTMTGPGGECLCAVMDDSWFDTVWYESQDEAETKIADSVRNIYSVERIRISRENLERDVVITRNPERNPERISFKCSCGCEFNESAESCRMTSGWLEGGDMQIYSTTTFWSHCPVCGNECSDLRIK